MQELAITLIAWVIENCPRVCKMDRQLNVKEATTLLEIYPIEDLQDQLINMESRCDIKKKSLGIWCNIILVQERRKRAKIYACKQTESGIASPG